MAQLKPRDFVVNCNQNLRACVYTVIPISQRRLLDAPYHFHRLKESYSLLSDCEAKSLSAKVDEVVLHSIISSLVNFSSDINNAVMTVCLGNDNKHDIVASSLCTALPPYTHQDGGVTVDMHLYSRITDPLVKAASWPEERVPIEKLKCKQAVESIICKKSKEGGVFQATEGLVSNFFVVSSSDTLITAPKGEVLEGSMQRLVLATAETLGIAIERRFPELPSSSMDVPAERMLKGAFLTSKHTFYIPIEWPS
jgi:branched-subunit amino acid aminotransferase/4-amino-4-deoxychorismate lyase